MTQTVENDALDTYCFRWDTYWPHAAHDPLAIQTTTDRSKVTCLACLHALGSQKHDPPRVTPPEVTG